jgi:hypothetical protein
MRNSLSCYTEQHAIIEHSSINQYILKVMSLKMPHKSNPTSNARIRQAQTVPSRPSRLARCLGASALTLCTLGRAITWDARAARAPHHQAEGVSGPFNQGEAEMRIYCNSHGSALKGELNTGHCAIAVRGNAHLPWLIYETGNDKKGELFTGTMERHFAGVWTPFDDTSIFRTRRLTADQFDTLTKVIDEYWEKNKTHQAWSIFHNCADFAAQLWGLSTGEHIRQRYLPFSTPRLLAQAITYRNSHPMD